MDPSFDEQGLLDRVDGDVEFLQETIEMLEEDVAPLLDHLGQATAARNPEAIVVSAHAIKGRLANFCAEPAETAPGYFHGLEHLAGFIQALCPVADSLGIIDQLAVLPDPGFRGRQSQLQLGYVLLQSPDLGLQAHKLVTPPLQLSHPALQAVDFLSFLR